MRLMKRDRYLKCGAGAILALLGGTGCSQRPSGVAITPSKMKLAGTVDPRFQSFNVEMLEVTGGRFWKPYQSETGARDSQSSAKQSGPTPSGMDPNLYEYRPPIDLTNPRLRKLAEALKPSYVRVSGTWANTTYFHDSDKPAPAKPPKGFDGVLTRQQWKGVIDFARATDAGIVTSFATSPGTRNAAGVWTPEEARKLLAFTKSMGGAIAAAEFMNEPTYAAMGGAPKGYDAAAYGRDTAVFHQFIKQTAPDMLFLGPGSVGEGGSLAIPNAGMLKSEDLLKATGDVFDVFSYHLYAAVSKRCASMGESSQTTAEAALSDEWLARTDTIHGFYASLRDKFAPGKPMWITETADTACGGNPWASTFLDTFRYLDQHGRLAQRGVKVIAHNTLASSDYGLLDEKTFSPRPNYWATLLWRRLMGTTVLDPGVPHSGGLYLYAHCLRDHPGGVALLAINADRQASHDLALPVDADRYTLTAKNLQDNTVQLNGSTLETSSDGGPPPLNGAHTAQGRAVLEPASITFFAFPNAGNNSCR